MQAQISPQVFYSHVEKLRKTWANKYVDELDSIILINGKATNGNQKTVAIVSWLFAAYNLTDTIIAFSQKEIIIYASQRKITFLNNIKKHSNADKFNLKFIQKTQNLIESFNNIWQILHKDKINPRIGMFIKDERIGQVAEEFNKFLNQISFQSKDIFPFFNECFISKDSDEIQNLKKSSLVSCYFLQKFIKEIQKVIDEGTNIKHHQIAGKVQDLLSNQSELKKCAIKITNSQSNLAFSKQYIDIGPSINVQSGGNYSSKLFATPNSNILKSDCILASLGTLYKSYNSYAARTLLINPTDQQKSYYKKCLAIMKVILQNLRPGIALNSVYNKVIEFMKSYLPNVQPPRSFGFGIGVFLSQNSLQISQHNSKTIQQGSSFLINCTLTGLKYNTKKGQKQFAIQIIQTVIITQKGQETLTSGISTSLSDISYQFDDQDEGTKTKSKNSNIISYQNTDGRPVTRRGAKYQVTVEKLKNQKKRNDHQMELKYKKLQELKERVNQNFIGGFKKQKNIDCSKLESYKSREDFPRQMKKNQIYIDNKNHTILLPINGKHIPFHIHTLKNVVKNDQGKLASLRFNFLLPGISSNLTFPKFNQTSVYIKQMVFRSQQVARIAELQKQIKALQKKVKVDISQKHAKEDIVEQQVLKINKGKRPILRELFARPYIGTKRIKGILQCHINGFRYTSGKEQIDVTFSNIRNAFFQPCEKQIIAAIHFRLHEPIIIGKKKCEDVQFYSEGGPNTEDVGGRGRGGMEQDSQDQQRQKQARRRLDKQFQHWIKSCEQFKGKSFEFEYPNRNGGFYGNHSKHNSLFQPTKNCLINVTQTPFFICALDEIQVVCYERIYANSKTFDIIIIMKDYENHLKINAIPIKDVQKVKDWLDSCNIIFYEQGKSLNWIKFLGNIRRDFKKFVDDGGWMAWDQADQQQEMRDQQDDVSYQASQSDFDDSEDSDDQTSNYQDEDDDSDEEDDSSQSLSEQGLDSDEMQERAELEDRERQRREREKQREKMKKKR